MKEVWNKQTKKITRLGLRPKPTPNLHPTERGPVRNRTFSSSLPFTQALRRPIEKTLIQISPCNAIRHAYVRFGLGLRRFPLIVFAFWSSTPSWIRVPDAIASPLFALHRVFDNQPRARPWLAHPRSGGWWPRANNRYTLHLSHLQPSTPSHPTSMPFPWFNLVILVTKSRRNKQ